MKEISIAAELSQTYTNHSIRATTITILDDKGYEARHIKTVSGHRSDSSLKSYRRTNLNTKRKMCEDLSWKKYEIFRKEDLPPKNFDFGVRIPTTPERVSSSLSSSSSGNEYYSYTFNINY